MILVESKIPPSSDYDWVVVRVREYFLKYRWLSMLQYFADSIDILDDNVADDIVSLHKLKSPILFVMDDKIRLMTFFYFYSFLITNVHFRFPLNDFFVGVLQVLNVTPTQLLPNRSFNYYAWPWIWGRHLKFFFTFITLRPGTKWVTFLDQSAEDMSSCPLYFFIQELQEWTFQGRGSWRGSSLFL